ncbi:hypothetical protein [Bacillus toyonensis]|uniref:hypothetical protein n=1 Tax=Bacillus toyonensis TaxID=155322 RepID=UPI002E22D565|nr:hypothetical protein [Bacillus toyonensis]
MLNELIHHFDSLKEFFKDINGITFSAIKQVSANYPNQITLHFTSKIGFSYYVSAITIILQPNRIYVSSNLEISIPKQKLLKKLIASHSKIIDIILNDILPTFVPSVYLRYSFLPVRYPSYYKVESLKEKKAQLGNKKR